MDKARERLEQFLKTDVESDIQQLTPDASTREYFRIPWKEKTAIACVYPEPFLPKDQTYLDVANLFQKANLPVAEIYGFDGDAGIIIQEDFGDTILRSVLEGVEIVKYDALVSGAISLIAKIQSATALAFELDSIASRLIFDREKLAWELDFFKTHYFTSLQKQPLSKHDDGALDAEFADLSIELERCAKVLCHRDYHAANLMIDAEDKLRVIDHQDARIGSVAYDLVSLLLDRVLQPPDSVWLRQKKEFFLSEREKLGLEKLSLDEFDHEFDLMTVQRCLKAIGTFSNQTANCGKTSYIQFIMPMFQIVLETLDRLDQFPVLRSTIKSELGK
jgi:N-acetylmuramate 1-kinase